MDLPSALKLGVTSLEVSLVSFRRLPATRRNQKDVGAAIGPRIECQVLAIGRPVRAAGHRSAERGQPDRGAARRVRRPDLIAARSIAAKRDPFAVRRIARTGIQQIAGNQRAAPAPRPAGRCARCWYRRSARQTRSARRADSLPGYDADNAASVRQTGGRPFTGKRQSRTRPLCRCDETIRDRPSFAHASPVIPVRSCVTARAPPPLAGATNTSPTTLAVRRRKASHFPSGDRCTSSSPGVPAAGRAPPAEPASGGRRIRDRSLQSATARPAAVASVA